MRTPDLDSARAFMAAHARVLDRRRFELLLGEGDPDAVVAATDAYRNPDGGYGWGLEPDLRSPESQPGGALHALEAFADCAPAITPRAAELCDWLGSVTLPDGGLPFALPVTGATAVAPFWAGADPARSSLQITAYVTAQAHRVARHDPAVAGHEWLGRATRYCLGAVDATTERPGAMTVAAALGVLDAVPEGRAALERLAPFIPADGRLRVTGGAEDEYMRPLDLAPAPDSVARGLLAGGVVEADLERLVGDQLPDGGWRVDFDSYSPAATLEWRGHMTVRALWVLRRNEVV